MPSATACPTCGRPAPPKSALTQQKDLDSTQFIRLAPGELLPEEAASPVAPSSADPPAGVSRHPLVLALILGLLAGMLLLAVVVMLARVRH